MGDSMAAGELCTGVVLAGGASSRLGGAAKGLLDIGGRRLIDRVLDALRAVTPAQLIVAKDVSAIAALVPNVRVAADLARERSSLVGVHAALSHAPGAVLVVAWDMPFVTAPLLRAIRERGEREGGAVIPEGPRGPEPLCAYYPRASLVQATRQLDRGEHRLGAFVDSLPHRVSFSIDDVAQFGDPERLFTNVNSLDDLAEVQRALTGDAAVGASDASESSTANRR